MADAIADLKQKAEIAQDGAKKVGTIMDSTAEGIFPFEKVFPTSCFGCCGVKECGPMCCATLFFCGPCSYSMAVGNDAKITWPVADKVAGSIPDSVGGSKIRAFVSSPGFVPCLAAQAALSVFSCIGSSVAACDCGITGMAALGCTLGFYGYNHTLLVKKYSLGEEPMTNVVCKTICCGPCLALQDMNLALTKEGTTWMVAPGVGCVAPKNESMRLN